MLIIWGAARRQGGDGADDVRVRSSLHFEEDSARESVVQILARVQKQRATVKATSYASLKRWRFLLPHNLRVSSRCNNTGYPNTGMLLSVLTGVLFFWRENIFLAGEYFFDGNKL